MPGHPVTANRCRSISPLLVAAGLVIPLISCEAPPRPTGRDVRITQNGSRFLEAPLAVSDRLIAFDMDTFTNARGAYDRDDHSTRTMAENALGSPVLALDDYVVWPRLFTGSSTTYLGVWSRESGVFGASGALGTNASLRAVGSVVLTRAIVGGPNGLEDRIAARDLAAVGPMTPLADVCGGAGGWDARDRYVAWTCPYQPAVFVLDRTSGETTPVPMPPGAYRPTNVALADGWVVWVDDAYATADVYAWPLAGGDVRTLATDLPASSSVLVELEASGHFAYWSVGEPMMLHDLARNVTETVVSATPREDLASLRSRYLIWQESVDERFSGPVRLRIRSHATGAVSEESLLVLSTARPLVIGEDAIAYRGDDGDLHVLEIDGDADGLRDRDERRFALGDPDLPDGDGDGTPDGDEDPDGDGLTSAVELDQHRTDPTVADSDADGASDGQELALGLDPLDADGDDDGLLDGAELALGTDPAAPDTDGDGLTDHEEAELGTNPIAFDGDGDGVGDGLEVRVLGTEPSVADSDGDGLSDGAEDADGDGVANADEVGQTPFAAADTDGDGAADVIDDDDDGDGIPTRDEDRNGNGDLRDDDRDGDGLADYVDALPGTVERGPTVMASPFHFASSMRHVAWVATPSDEADYEIFLFERATGQAVQISHNDFDDWSPQIDGDYVVWYGGGAAADPESSELSMRPNEIYLYRISTGETTRLTSNGYLDRTPTIRGDFVAWDGLVPGDAPNASQFRVFLHRISTGATKPIAPPFLLASSYFPKVGDRFVAFYVTFPYGETRTRDIYLYDLETDGLERLTETPDQDEIPQIRGRDLVFTRSWVDSDRPCELVHVDLVTRAERTLGVEACENVVLGDGLVAWSSSGTEPGVYVHDLLSNRTRRVSDHDDAFHLDLGGATVAWTRWLDTGIELHAFELRAARHVRIPVQSGWRGGMLVDRIGTVLWFEIENDVEERVAFWDGDADDDTLPNSQDACLALPGLDQRDADGDGSVGDADVSRLLSSLYRAPGPSGIAAP